MSTVSEILSLLDKIPIWKRLSSLPEKVDSLEKRLADLETKMAGGGEKCPRCGEYSFAVVSSRPHPIYGDMGGIERTYECKACGLSEKKLIE